MINHHIKRSNLSFTFRKGEKVSVATYNVVDDVKVSSKSSKKFTADLLERFGKELFSVFAHSLKLVMRKLFPNLTSAEWLGKLLQSYHEGMSSLEIMVYLELLDLNCLIYRELNNVMYELGKVLEKHSDVNVRRSFMYRLSRSCFIPRFFGEKPARLFGKSHTSFFQRSRKSEFNKACLKLGKLTK